MLEDTTVRRRVVMWEQVEAGGVLWACEQPLRESEPLDCDPHTCFSVPPAPPPIISWGLMLTGPDWGGSLPR